MILTDLTLRCSRILKFIFWNTVYRIQPHSFQTYCGNIVFNCMSDTFILVRLIGLSELCLLFSRGCMSFGGIRYKLGFSPTPKESFGLQGYGWTVDKHKYKPTFVTASVLRRFLVCLNLNTFLKKYYLIWCFDDDDWEHFLSNSKHPILYMFRWADIWWKP